MDPIGDVTVVAPDTNQSAVGHQKTLMRPLRVRERTLADGSMGYSVDGSPTDAVSLAFLGYFEERFDLVASGINYGANLGDDITYSGTVSAAMEGVINNCPSFAISQEYYEQVDFALASLAAAIVARNILEHGLKRGELLSVNVPAVSIDDCEGFEVTRVGRRVYQDQLVARVDPRGIPYYWLGGPPPSGISVPGTDFNAVVNRRVSVTPLHLDLTGRQPAAQAQGVGLVDPGGRAPATGRRPSCCRRRPGPTRPKRRGSPRSHSWSAAERRPAAGIDGCPCARDDPRRVMLETAPRILRACSSSAASSPPRRPTGQRPRASRAGPGTTPRTSRRSSACCRCSTAEPVVWLSTVRPDGPPHLVPTWFWWDGEALLVFSKPDAVKVRNLRANPRLMVALGHPESDFSVGLIEAEAALEPGAADDPGRVLHQVRRAAGRRRARPRDLPRHLHPGRSASSRPASSRGAGAVPCTRPRSGQSARPCRTRRPCRSAGRCSRPGPDDPRRRQGPPSPASRP